MTMTDPADDDESGGLWVRSEVMPNGTYGVALNVGADRAWSLDRDRAVAYAVACFARATEAEHDAAVFGMLTSVNGIDEELAALLIARDLRPGRADEHDDTKPLKYNVVLNRNRITGEIMPMLHMHLDGVGKAGELTPADLRDHAGGVLNVLHAADLDAGLHKVLIGKAGLDDDTARAMIGTLGEHWPEQRPPRTAADHP